MPRPRNRNRNRGRNNPPRRQGPARPTFSLPEVDLPPFLLELLGGEGIQPYVPRSEGALRAEARSQAGSAIAPGLAQIESAMQGGRQAIGDLTGEIYQRMLPIAGQTRDLYGAAGQQTQGYEEALRQGLIGQGQQAASQLGEQFQQAGLESSMPLAQGVGDAAAQAGQASFALGSTALQRLSAEGAAQAAHGARLPGVAQLGGQAALSALARESAAASAGIAAQRPGLEMDAYRSLRSSEDARADASNQRRAQLAGMLMDWNQNLQNIELQTYLTDLGFFGDRQEARASAREFAQEMGLRQDEFGFQQSQAGQAQSNWEREFQQHQEEIEAAAAKEAREGRAAGRQNYEDFIDEWTGKATSRAEQLKRGYYSDSAGGGGIGSQAGQGGSRQHHDYTYAQALRRLTRFLSGPLSSNEARRYGIKPSRATRRLVMQALEAAGFMPPGNVRGGGQAGPTLR